MKTFETILIFEEMGRNLASPLVLAVKNLKTGETTYPGQVYSPKSEDFHKLINEYNELGYELRGVNHGDFYLSKVISRGIE